MTKLIAAITGVIAAGSALTILGIGSSDADTTTGGTLNVLGEPYYKAVAILRAQGVPTRFGGSVGSEVAQAQCLVQSQKYLTTGTMQLMLNCTKAAQSDDAPQPGNAGKSGDSGSPQDSGSARPTPGAAGVVTVTPTRVG